MSYNSQNQKLGIAFKKQTDLATENVGSDFWLLSKVNAGFGKFACNFDNDASDIGKGDEFPTTTFPLTKDVSMTVEKRLSSEFAAWLFQFGFGTANTVTAAEGTTGTKYTCKPMDTCDGLDMPAFTAVETLGAGCPGGAGLDRAGIGMVVNDWKISFTSGPGRNNSMCSANLVGTGKTAEPSTITLPSTPLAEHLLAGSSATVTIDGIDYVANKSLLSLEMSFGNNVKLDSGYFIGSGIDSNGFALRGRMEHGNRAFGLTYTARLEQGSTEYAKLKAATKGTAVVTLTGQVFESSHNHKLTVTYPKVQITSVDLGDDNGTATVQVTVTPLADPTDGICTAEIVTTVANIG